MTRICSSLGISFCSPILGLGCYDRLFATDVSGAQTLEKVQAADPKINVRLELQRL